MGQRTYNKFLAKIFSDESNYITGQELNKIIQKKFDVNASYGRKIIQRAVDSKIMRSSFPLTFGKGQYVYFNLSNKLNIDTIKIISYKYRPSLYRLLSQLELNNGILSFYEGLKVTASPLENGKTKATNLKSLTKTLSDLQIIEEVTDKRGIKYIILSKYSEESDSLIEKHYTKMIVDTMFIPDILNWLKDTNLIDNDRILFRNKKKPSLGAKHNNFVWDAFAYTKTTGINTVYGNNSETEDTSTLVVIEIVISRKFTDLDLQGFFDRIQIVRNSVKSNKRKILPIVIYKDISIKASNKINALGFACFSLGSIYGQKIYDIIDSLSLIKLEESIEMQNSDLFVDQIKNVLSSIRTAGQEANLENIKGDLFESLMYAMVQNLFPISKIEPNKELTKQDNKDEYYEYDLIIDSHIDNEFIIMELKGYKSTSIIKLGTPETKNTIRWFFRTTFPNAQKHYKKMINNNDELFGEYSVKACYITTAKFEDDGIEKLKQINNGILKPSKLDVFYDGQKLLKLLDDNKLKNISKVVEKYFIDKEGEIIDEDDLDTKIDKKLETLTEKEKVSLKDIEEEINIIEAEDEEWEKILQDLI